MLPDGMRHQREAIAIGTRLNRMNGVMHIQQQGCTTDLMHTSRYKSTTMLTVDRT